VDDRALRRGVLLTVAYQGGPFAGFAHQPDQRTVAGELLSAIRSVDASVEEIRGASRTDAGVHARAQRVAFDAHAPIPAKGWTLGLNRVLPASIAVVRAATAPSGFTPRFACRGKLYSYRVLDDSVRDPFLEGLVWRVQGVVHAEGLARMRAEAAALVGTHDFAAFRSSADERINTTRTLRRCDVTPDPGRPGLVRIDVEGDAFLHNMVRILVGTLVDVARGRLEPGACRLALASKQRSQLGMTAPPDGLTLERVDLNDDGVDPWPASCASPEGAS